VCKKKKERKEKPKIPKIPKVLPKKRLNINNTQTMIVSRQVQSSYKTIIFLSPPPNCQTLLSNPEPFHQTPLTNLNTGNRNIYED